MLDNIGWIAYGITCLTAIHGFLDIVALIGLIYLAVVGVIALFSDSIGSGEDCVKFIIGKLKPTLKYLIPVLLLSVFIPTKEDGMLIVGVQAGANAIVQSGVALRDIKESELAGKLIELAETKIDNAIKAESVKDEPSKESK